MSVSLTFRSQVIQSFTYDEVLCNSTNEKLINCFGSLEEDIVQCCNNDIKNLSVSGGQISFVKLSDEGVLGTMLLLNSKRNLSQEELLQLSKEMSKQMGDHGYFGPDGLFCYVEEEDREYYVLPIHPDFEKKPIEILQSANV